MSIFVAIASYCDPWLWKTVEDCYRQAKYPQRLCFGIFDQNHTDGFDYSETLPFKNQIHYQCIPTRDALGLSWARDRVFSLYTRQRFFMQIDSHCCFDKHWDQTLLDFYDELHPKHHKLILTGYPMRCVPEDGVLVPGMASKTDVQYITRPFKNSVLRADSTNIQFNAIGMMPELQPYPAIQLSGGFMFASGQFILDVPYDPRLGHVDEQNMSIRAYTHGWDMMHPPYVPFYHYYNERGKPWDSELCWNAEVEAKRRQKFHVHNRRGELRMCQMLYHGQDFGVYGLGRSRTLADFAQYSGIDYPQRRIYWRYPDKNEDIADTTPAKTEAELWQQLFIGPSLPQAQNATKPPALPDETIGCKGEDKKLQITGRVIL